MLVLCIVLLVALLVLTDALIPLSSHRLTRKLVVPRTSSMARFSTLAPTPTDLNGLSDDDDDDNDDEEDKNVVAPPRPSSLPVNKMKITMKKKRKNKNKKGGISMTVDELAQHLDDGYGRARLAWDCYSIGVDPALFYGSIIRLGHDDFETIYDLLPTSRRRQTMGKDALELLGKLYSSSDNSNDDNDDGATGGGGRVEGGVASLSHVSMAHDKTTKLLLKLSDGLEIETVIIPWNGIRSTLCISSQVGCRQGTCDILFVVEMIWFSPLIPHSNCLIILPTTSIHFMIGCRFCATGKMGKLRSLMSDEILAQMFFARKICRLNGLPPITNAVFMGMGEPADNVDAVRTAVDILTDRQLFQLSAQKVTISTIAPTPEAFREFAHSPCVLAWSVHAANDLLRRQLVPSTKYKMVELRQGLIDALLQRPKQLRATMLEVALMAGINDSEKEADELAEFASEIVRSVPGCKLVVNLIPYNEIGGSEQQQHGDPESATGEEEEEVQYYKKPSPEAVILFQKRLWSHGIYAHIRKTRGDDATAACGQLATTTSTTNNIKKKQLQLHVNGTIPTSDNRHLQ